MGGQIIKWHSSSPTAYCRQYNYEVINHTMKNYRIQVTTFDGLKTIWYEKSKAKKATDIICRRVYDQLCGLNIKEIDVTLSV